MRRFLRRFAGAIGTIRSNVLFTSSSQMDGSRCVLELIDLAQDGKPRCLLMSRKQVLEACVPGNEVCRERRWRVGQQTRAL